MKHWMFRCDEITKKVSLSMDENLPLLHRMAIRFHLSMCRYCSRFRRQLLLLRKTGRTIGEEEEASPESSAGLSTDARERIKSSLRAHR